MKPVEAVNESTNPQSILKTALTWHDAGTAVALATVIKTWGSSPRPAGSNLVIAADGAFEGSVSGGCVEGAVIHAAKEVTETGEPRLLEFGVTDDEAWAVGLACGGQIEIYLERIT
jgi:xanthine/CO dehydrogenase XdhC/CoxF family maturation factor